MKSGKLALWLLSAALVAAAALPAAASAGEPKIDPANGTFPVPFTATGGYMKLTNSSVIVTCAGYKATGKFTSATTGSIETTFEKCGVTWGGSSLPCNTVGQSSGTITFAESTFHLVYLTEGKTVPGVLITPPTGGLFSNTSCMGEVRGAGYMGSLVAPSCGKASSTFTVAYEVNASGTQKYRQVTGTGTLFNLQALGAETALISTTTNSWALEQSATLTCV
jgi:hypothetical protein